MWSLSTLSISMGTGCVVQAAVHAVAQAEVQTSGTCCLVQGVVQAVW